MRGCGGSLISCGFWEEVVMGQEVWGAWINFGWNPYDCEAGPHILVVCMYSSCPIPAIGRIRTTNAKRDPLVFDWVHISITDTKCLGINKNFKGALRLHQLKTFTRGSITRRYLAENPITLDKSFKFYRIFTIYNLLNFFDPQRSGSL